MGRCVCMCMWCVWMNERENVNELWRKERERKRREKKKKRSDSPSFELVFPLLHHTTTNKWTLCRDTWQGYVVVQQTIFSSNFNKFNVNVFVAYVLEWLFGFKSKHINKSMVFVSMCWFLLFFRFGDAKNKSVSESKRGMMLMMMMKWDVLEIFDYIVWLTIINRGGTYKNIYIRLLFIGFNLYIYICGF